MTQRIAVIGAGLAGLTVARQLDHQHQVTVFEKARGPGGRMATRYAGGYEFDHGAQFFTARCSAFKSFLRPLIAAGVVGEWRARFVELQRSNILSSRHWDQEFPHYVGTPRMNAIGKWLAEGLDVRLQNRVSRLDSGDGGWMLSGDDGACLGYFDWIICSAPAPQTADLLPAGSAPAAACEKAGMQACCALLLGFTETIDPGFDAAIVRGADISWMSVNSSKPGRDTGSSVVIHSTNNWADAHLDDPPSAIIDYLCNEAQLIPGLDPAAAEFRDVQRWRYANLGKRGGERFAIDPQRQLAACGDWFVRGRVESAFSSAHRLGEELLASI